MKGNINVPNGGELFYVHYDSMNLYIDKNKPEDGYKMKKEIPSYGFSRYTWDKKASQQKYDTWLNVFKSRMCKKFKSLKPVDQYAHRSQRIILQNKLFIIAIEDNEWSFAVELMENEDSKCVGLQRRHFGSFYKGLKSILMDTVDQIYIRTGSWTAQPVDASSPDVTDQHISATKLKIDPKVKATGGFGTPDEPKTDKDGG